MAPFYSLLGLKECLVECATLCVKSEVICTKSLYRSRAGRDFYGTENDIWAGFGVVGNYGNTGC